MLKLKKVNDILKIPGIDRPENEKEVFLNIKYLNEYEVNENLRKKEVNETQWSILKLQNKKYDQKSVFWSTETPSSYRKWLTMHPFFFLFFWIFSLHLSQRTTTCFGLIN